METVTLNREDYNEYTWFDILRVAGQLPVDISYHSVIDPETEKPFAQYQHLFGQDEMVELPVAGTLTERERELARIGAIIADNHMPVLYEKFEGYIAVLDWIAAASYKLYLRFKDTDWDDVWENPEQLRLGKVCCWDEVIIESSRELVENI